MLIKKYKFAWCCSPAKKGLNFLGPDWYLHLSFAKSDQVTQHPHDPGFNTFARESSADLPSFVRNSVPLFLLGWFQLFFAPAPCLKLWFGYIEPLHSHQKGWFCEAAPLWVRWGSAELIVCSSGVKPVPTQNSHREFLHVPPTGNSVLQEQEQWGSNPPKLNQPGVCLFLVTTLLALNPNSQSLRQIRMINSEQQRRSVPRYVHFSLLRAGLLLVFLTCLTAKWSS